MDSKETLKAEPRTQSSAHGVAPSAQASAALLPFEWKNLQPHQSQLLTDKELLSNCDLHGDVRVAQYGFDHSWVREKRAVRARPCVTRESRSDLFKPCEQSIFEVDTTDDEVRFKLLNSPQHTSLDTHCHASFCKSRWTKRRLSR